MAQMAALGALITHVSVFAAGYALGVRNRAPSPKDLDEHYELGYRTGWRNCLEFNAINDDLGKAFREAYSERNKSDD